MATTFPQFLADFVLPLLQGGPVQVDRPLRPKERDLWIGEVPHVASDLAFVRLRRAHALTPHPVLDEPDDEELSLWVGLHNVLVFDHPDRSRVWSRGTTWRRVEGATRTLLSLPFPNSVASTLARHVSVGAFLELERTDTVVTSPSGEHRFLGQDPPRRRFGFGPPLTGSTRAETFRWFDLPHTAEARRLLEDVLRASPLTCLLEPRRAPAGWSPLLTVDVLRQRGLARSVVHHWARSKDWIAVGGAVMSALLPSVIKPDLPPPPSPSSGMLALPGAVPATSPDAFAVVVGALIHLHFLKVLEFDARLGLALGSRDPGILAFLGLPLLLPSLGGVMGTPLSGLTVRGASMGSESFEAGSHRRWNEYLEHLGELVPKAAVENLLAGLVPAIVKPQ